MTELISERKDFKQTNTSCNTYVEKIMLLTELYKGTFTEILKESECSGKVL